MSKGAVARRLPVKRLWRSYEAALPEVGPPLPCPLLLWQEERVLPGCDLCVVLPEVWLWVVDLDGANGGYPADVGGVTRDGDNKCVVGVVGGNADVPSSDVFCQYGLCD